MKKIDRSHALVVIKQGLLITLLFTIDYFWFREIFLFVLYFYVLFIRFLLSEDISQNFRKILAMVIWISFLSGLFLVYYSNHYFPLGPKIYTGDFVCVNDGRGPCNEQFIEDTRNLDISGWAKFFKQSEGELMVFGLLIAGLAASKGGRSE